MLNSLSYLLNSLQIFLVGTAHVSKASSEEVRDMIRLVKPQSVMVELCQQRAARLRAGGGNDDGDFLRVGKHG
jgi:pheromone shutdown protein TraB